MRPGAVPVVQDFKLFQQSTLACLDDQPSGTFAGTSKYGSICWVARGAQLEVLDLGTLNRRASWQFGRILGDEHTTITCVEEMFLKNDSSTKLIVGISNSSPNGLICVFDVNTQRIEKSIEIRFPVTAVEIVCASVGDSIPRWALSEHLRYFCGIVAVGCSSGHTFLIDLRLDDKETISSEAEPCKVELISPRNRDVENQRLQCLMKGFHLCIAINESLFTENGFEYQKPDGVVMKTFRQELVTVTCLTYIPQTGILAIGYSFGCYQLWKLQIPVLEYSSRLESDPMPVTRIAHQEPENDPKNFCYLWVARSQMDPEEEYANSVATVSLYQLSFGKKTYYNGYGVFYDELTSICLRVDHELTSQPVQYGSNYDGASRVLACYTLTDPYYQPPTRLTEDSFDESNHGPDLSLCVFVWEATEGKSSKAGYHLSIFDINRWYHAQMPSTIRYVSPSVETCSYMCFYKLNEGKELMENLLTVHVDTGRIQRFLSNSPLPPEQHFYPSSLEFDATLIFDSGTVKAKFLGDQGQVLSNLRRNGPVVLLHPQEMYNMCIYVGLLARPMEIVSTSMNMTYQRECLLSLALDYEILSLFSACIADWASGEYLHQGCSLKVLLDWAWQKVSSTKHQIDTTCVSLYNWSGLILDQRGTHTLYQCEQKLSHLVSIFKLFTNQSVPITQQGDFEIQSKILVSSILSKHLSVVLWFIHVGLLPENDDTEVMTGFRYAYPVTSLLSAYKARRMELQNLNSHTELLMIDGLVKSCNGVEDLWEREGGNGKYPPPSLHALLSTYLLENVDTQIKYCLTLYLLLDLVSMETAEDSVTFSDKIAGFTSRYNLPQALVKQVQAFWLLDHKDFEEAMMLLETQRLTSDLSHWQHRCILQALFYQGEVKMALRYLYIANPPLYSLEDIKLKLTVLLANGFVAEALDCHRKNSSKSDMKDLLTHVFYGCQQTKTTDRLLGQLGTDEEKMLEEYLEGHDPLSMDLLVMHYLQSSRIVEAFNLNEKLKQYILTEASPKARERAAARNAIVDRYIAVYPSIQRKLLFEQIHVPKRNTQLRRVVRRPTPLSTNVTKSKASVLTQSTYIMKIMEKIDEIEAVEDSPEKSSNAAVGPFLCTPVVPSRKSFMQSPTTVLLGTEDILAKDSLTAFRKSITQDDGTPTGSDKSQRRLFSASCLTLLQTPKVKKVTPEKQRRSATNIVTPQSILKVRNLVNITSPSPHSGGSTPSSQETGTSSKKMQRKLGYSSQSGTPRSVVTSDQAVSGIPRHLLMEVQTSSRPTTPKSVSFIEPVTPTDTSPTDKEKPANVSQTATPKSVSFRERTFISASQLEPLATPEASERKVSRQKSPPVPPKTSPKFLTPPISPNLVKERSPTSESSQHSPNLSGHLDQLCRRPLHDHSPTLEAQDEYPVLQLEESDENISDDEMETDTGAEVKTSKLDSSVTSAVSRETAFQVTSKPSPQEHSEFIWNQTSLADVSVKEERHLVEVENEIAGTGSNLSLGKTASPTAHEQTNMEVEEEGILLSDSKEIFSKEEEIPAGPLQEIDDKLDTVSSSNDLGSSVEVVAVKQEVQDDFYDPPNLTRKLSPSSFVTQEKHPSPVKMKPSPPSSVNDVTTTSPDADIVHGDSPIMEENEKEPVAGRSDIQATKSKVLGKFKFYETVPESETAELVKQESDETETEIGEKGRITPTRSSRRRKELDNSAEASKEPVTPPRSTRRSKKDPDVTVTPTRASQRKAKKEENLVVITAVSPKSFSRKARNAVQESLLSISTEMKSVNETSPTEMTKIRNINEQPVTPTRTPNRSRKNAQVHAEVDLEPGKATPSRSQKDKTETNDALEESDHEKVKSQTPTRGKKKNETVSQKASPGKKTKSPARNKNNNSENVQTPTRKTQNEDGDEGIALIETESIDAVPLTPTRKSSRLKKEKSEAAQSEKDIGRSDIPVDITDIEPSTPSRRTSLSRSCKTVNDMASDSQPVISNSESFGKSEIPEDFVETEDGSKSPLRRKSLSRASKDMAEMALVALTPSRRRSIGRSSKKGETDSSSERDQLTKIDEIENETKKTPTRRKTKKAEVNSDGMDSLVKTPTRRGRPLETDSSSERDQLTNTDEIENDTKKTPTRRRKTKTAEVNPEKSNDKSTTDGMDTLVKTPTRRGRPSKAVKESKEEDTEKSESPTTVTPSRRKRVKKEEKKEDTPSRHTRSHDETQVAAIYDIQSTSFQFSNPMEVDSVEVTQGPKSFTPVKSFIFSPPIQHTKSRLEQHHTDGVNDDNEQAEALPDSSESEPKIEPKNTRKTRVKKLYKQQEEVLLISPVYKEDSNIGEDGLNVVTGATRARTRKADSKKEGTKSAVQSILANIGRRPKRTSHRIGPLGQKK